MRAASSFTTIALSAVLVACGSETPTRSAGTAPPDVDERGDCQAVGETDQGSLQLCLNAGRDEQGRFVFAMDTTLREVDVSLPGATPSASDAGRAGHWAWAALAPDRQRILAQWSAECEVPAAFFVDLETGETESVTGEADWAQSPESVALGWTTDGRAIIFLPKGPACGSGVKSPGVYLYSAPGRGELLLQGKKPSIRGSKTPRSVAALRRAGS